MWKVFSRCEGFRVIFGGRDMLQESLEYVRIFALNRCPIDAFVCFRFFILVCQLRSKEVQSDHLSDKSVLNWCFLGILSSLLWRSHFEANNVLRCFGYTEFRARGKLYRIRVFNRPRWYARKRHGNASVDADQSMSFYTYRKRIQTKTHQCGHGLSPWK